MIEVFRNVNLNENSRVYVDCEAFTTGTVQFVPRSGTFGNVVLTIKCTNNLDAPWSDAPGTLVTLSTSARMTAVLDLGWKYIAAEVTTMEGSAATGDILFCLKE